MGITFPANSSKLNCFLYYNIIIKGNVNPLAVSDDGYMDFHFLPFSAGWWNFTKYLLAMDTGNHINKTTG